MKTRNIILTIITLLILVFTSISVSGLTGFEYLNASTKLYYSFEDVVSTNNSLVRDLTGVNNLTSKNGAYNVTGILGGAISCDGINDYLITSNNIDTSSNIYSYSFWINRNTTSAQNVVVSKARSGTEAMSLIGFANDAHPSTDYNKIGMDLLTSSWSANSATAGVITSNGTYVHIVFTRNGGTVQVYVNGVLSTTQASYGTTVETTRALMICAYSTDLGATYGLNSKQNIDEFALFTKVLNQTEVSFLYGNYPGGTPGVVTSAQQYPFNEVIPIVASEINFINQTPSDITNINLFNTGNATIYYNVSKPNINYTYINYTVNNSRGIFEIVNGSVTKSGYFQSNSTSFVNNISRYDIGADNGIYPGINNLPYLTFNQSHTYQTLTGTNDFLKFALYNMSLENSQYLELDLKSNNSVCRVFYCNSSYTTGLIATNTNCFHFGTSTNQTTYNHTHGLYSGHNLYAFTLNSTGYIGSVKVSQNGFFAVNKLSGTSCVVGTVLNTTRTDTTQTSLTGGVVWNNEALTPDAHIHFFNTTYQDNFKYQACAVNATNTSCSSFRTDNFEITNFPPIVEILNPNPSNNSFNQYMNLSYGYILTGATNINFKIDLLNLDQTLNKTLVSNNSNLTSYYFNFYSFNVTPGSYYIKVTGNDSNGLSSFDEEEFNLTYTEPHLFSDVYFNFSEGFVNPTINITAQCNNSINNSVNMLLTFNGAILFNGSKTANTTQTNQTSLSFGTNTATVVCRDFLNSSTTTYSQVIYIAQISLIDERTNAAFNVANVTSAKIYLDNNNTVYDLKAVGNKSSVNFTQTIDTKLRVQLGYADGRIITRYIDISLLTGDIRICADTSDVTFYEQLIISATNQPVFLKSVYANCFIAADYTRFAYQDSNSLKAYTIDNLYYLYKYENGNQVLLASVDGTTQTYINIDTLEFSQQAYNFNVIEDAVAFKKISNTTVEIYYRNARNDNTALTVTITNADTNEVYFTSSSFTDPNEFTLYFDYSTLSGINSSTVFKITLEKTKSTGTTDILRKYFNTGGSSGKFRAGFIIIFQILILLFGLTFTAARDTFGWFGVFICLLGIGLSAFTIATWYSKVLLAVYLILLAYNFILMTQQNYRSIT